MTSAEEMARDLIHDFYNATGSQDYYHSRIMRVARRYAAEVLEEEAAEQARLCDSWCDAEPGSGVTAAMAAGHDNAAARLRQRAERERGE